MRILLLLIACIGFSCTDQGNPVALTSIPSGKANVDSDSGECLAIFWSCDTEVDSVWTVFYGTDYRFQAHGDSILFSHYVDSNRRREYWASETLTRFGRVRSGFRSDDETCGIWSEAIDNDTSVVRIYRGDVNYLYRDTPNARYILLEDDVQYPIAYVEEDESVRHRDFLSLFNRNDPRPDGLVQISSTYRVGAYYLPVNFSVAALDTLTALPEDDRPYLEHSICSGDECPAWAEPICPLATEGSVVARSVSVGSQTSEFSSGSGSSSGGGSSSGNGDNSNGDNSNGDNSNGDNSNDGFTLTCGGNCGPEHFPSLGEWECYFSSDVRGGRLYHPDCGRFSDWYKDTFGTEAYEDLFGT